MIVVSTPYNIMRLIQGYSYYYGSYKGFKMAGNQAMCAEITACTYVTNEINTSMMCSGTRFLSKWQKDEMAMGIPGDKYEKVIQGVYHTADPLERDADKERIKKHLKRIRCRHRIFIWGKIMIQTITISVKREFDR